MTGSMLFLSFVYCSKEFHIQLEQFTWRSELGKCYRICVMLCTFDAPDLTIDNLRRAAMADQCPEVVLTPHRPVPLVFIIYLLFLCKYSRSI